MRSGHTLWLSKQKHDEAELANRHAVKSNLELGESVFRVLPSHHMAKCLSVKIEQIQVKISDLENELLQRFISKSKLREFVVCTTDQREKLELTSDINRIDDEHVAPLLSQLDELRRIYDNYKRNRFWCLRASNIPGMISLDRLTYDLAEHQWVFDAIRFALVNGSWQTVGRHVTAVEGQLLVNAENIDEHINDLYQLLHRKGYHQDYMIKPRVDDQLYKLSAPVGPEQLPAAESNKL